jgi:2-polyprenyl-6-methoxyphenol hydroxylase-like FAD-dependent oxidoreductase
VRRAGVQVLRGTQVTSVSPGNQAEPASAVTEDGGLHRADLLIAADGARSTVRGAVDPEHPGARYAGVLLWRSLVDEQALPAGVALPAAGEPSREVYAGPYRLVTYLVPGATGETSVGRRRLNMVWYDPQQRELLRERALLEGETIRGSLAPGTLPDPVRERLAEFAAANWPAPWREALELALREGKVFGTPIVHYEPRRLARGRAALAGDAAHAASPMVGGGFRQGLYDVAALTQVLTAMMSPAEIPAVLGRYQELRLQPAAQHVAVSERATAAYLARAT